MSVVLNAIGAPVFNHSRVKLGTKFSFDPGCVKIQKKDDENNFPKSMATEQALEV